MLFASGFSTFQIVHTSSISLRLTSPLVQAQKHRLILQMTEGVMSVPEDGLWREDSCFLVDLCCIEYCCVYVLFSPVWICLVEVF